MLQAVWRCVQDAILFTNYLLFTLLLVSQFKETGWDANLARCSDTAVICSCLVLWLFSIKCTAVTD